MRLSLTIFAAMGLLALVGGCDQSTNADQTPAAVSRVVTGNGIIRGRVQFVGKPPAPKLLRNSPCCDGAPAEHVDETLIVSPDGSLRNVFVFIEGIGPTDGSARSPALLDQIHCRYEPHVLGVQVGQALRVRSSDPTMHNVHYVPRKNRARNLSMTGAGEETVVSFTHPEFIRIKCDVHPWMTAWVGVFENPFFAVTGDQGTFQITGLPHGEYELVAWHELLGRQQQKVAVGDEPIHVELKFGKAQ